MNLETYISSGSAWTLAISVLELSVDTRGHGTYAFEMSVLVAKACACGVGEPVVARRSLKSLLAAPTRPGLRANRPESCVRADPICLLVKVTSAGFALKSESSPG